MDGVHQILQTHVFFALHLLKMSVSLAQVELCQAVFEKLVTLFLFACSLGRNCLKHGWHVVKTSTSTLEGNFAKSNLSNNMSSVTNCLTIFNVIVLHTAAILHLTTGQHGEGASIWASAQQG